MIQRFAAVLFIAPGTVRKHLDNVYAKLGVRSRAQAVAVTVARGQSALIAESQALESLHD
jgi:DNA-binding CsgD family transcriptional regulator